MHDTDWLAERFEERRPRLTALAYRMLGSASEADDAVQEAWIRLSRTRRGRDREPGRLAHHRDLAGVPEHPAGAPGAARGAARPRRPRAGRRPESDPEQEALLADSIGLALLIVLDTLSPAERVAFVLHDMFALSFDEIAPIVGRNPPAARQLASRARRRVQREDASPEADRLRHAKLVDAFLAAARSGEFDRLLAVLDPDVVLNADQTAADSARRGSSTAPTRSPRSPATPAAPRRRCSTAPPRWSGSWTGAARRLPLHERRGQDHRDRPDRRSRAPARRSTS